LLRFFLHRVVHLTLSLFSEFAHRPLDTLFTNFLFLFLHAPLLLRNFSHLFLFLHPRRRRSRHEKVIDTCDPRVMQRLQRIEPRA
jgi:hypothetical protein